MRSLITANLKVLGTYPNDNDELIIAKRGSMTSGSSSFSSLDGIGSNIHVACLADLKRLFNSSSPIVENECQKQLLVRHVRLHLGHALLSPIRSDKSVSGHISEMSCHIFKATCRAVCGVSLKENT